MKNVKKKGFTIVELVIVVAVIAILAAVLIPTFSDLVKKANMSSDEVAVRNMNTILAVEQVMDDNIKDISKVRSILAQAGYNSDNLVPLSKNYKFYWSSTYNVVLLVNCESENKAEWQVIYPTEGYERAIEEFENFDNHGVSIFDLSNIPHAKVIKRETPLQLKNEDLMFRGQNFSGLKLLDIENSTVDFEDNTLTFDTTLLFSALETPEEAAENDYGDWFVDFVITSNKDLNEYPNTQIYLGGQYDAFGLGWIVLDIANSAFNVEAFVNYPLLGVIGSPFTYIDICGIENFQCAIAHTGDIPNDLIITVQLVMYESREAWAQTKPDHIIYEYKQIY